MVKLILFDIDGTLVRTGRAGMKAFAQTFATEFGYPEGTEKLKFAGRTDFSLVREFFTLNQREPTPHDFAHFFAVYTSNLQKMMVNCEGEIIPGVKEFMTALRALPQPPLFGLLTGNVRRGAEIKLQHFDLWREFPFGAFADDHEERDCIAAIARQRGEEILKGPLRDEEVVVIGDTPLDVRCARAIRAKIIAVSTGGHSLEELQVHTPHWTVADLRHLSAEEVCR